MRYCLCNSGAWVAVSACTLLFVGCQRQPETKPRLSAQIAVPSPSATSSLPMRGPIFFIKGDATLSPGAITKLKTWVETWGLNGKWTLACPSGPGFTYDLLERRILAIRTELQKLGISTVETKLLPSGPVGQYDAIYLVKEPS